MDNLPKTSVYSRKYWYDRLISFPAVRISVYVICLFLLGGVLLSGYLKYIYKGSLALFLLDKFPNSQVVRGLIPDDKLSSLGFEKIGKGSYFLKLKGQFVSLKEDENNNNLVYLTVDTYLGERIEVAYHKSYSRIYWNAASLTNNPDRFSDARYFPDPTGSYPGWDVVGNGYSYLLPGDIVEVYLIVDEGIKNDIEQQISKLEDKIKEKRVYFLFAKVYK
jgi:hypothetical protein